MAKEFKIASIMSESLKEDRDIAKHTLTGQDGLTAAEMTQLQRFLPANLMQSLTEAGVEPPRSVISACVSH